MSHGRREDLDTTGSDLGERARPLTADERRILVHKPSILKSMVGLDGVDRIEKRRSLYSSPDSVRTVSSSRNSTMPSAAYSVPLTYRTTSLPRVFSDSRNSQ